MTESTPPPKSKRRWRWLPLGVASLLGLALLGLWRDLERFAITPLDTAASAKVVTLARGAGLERVSLELQRQGIIASPLRFRYLARLRRMERRLQAGEYQVSAAMTPQQILELLASGRVYLHRLTIPEGLSLRQIARLVGEQGLVSEADFLAATGDATLQARCQVPAGGFEGYLFPETYSFARGTSATQIVAAMAERFWAVFTPQWREQAGKLGLSLHAVVTLASIVEKETGVAAERPLIASVFFNRLKRGMRLETDPTVIYGIGEAFDGNLTRRHLETATAYNTYLIPGLPPGPIANPGRGALEAVLFPAETNFYYFVARGDQTHQFSTTWAEHQAAVRRYQLRR